MDALAHTIAMLIGDELGTKGTYRRYRWRGKTYLIRKD